VELLGIRFLAPGFLALLALPLAALWLGARGGAVLALVTGTLESWRAAERNRPAQERRRRRLPPALVCLATALVFAALALARPERVSATAPRRITLVVDRSPSMYLVEQGRTRLERALEPLRKWAATELRAGDELVRIDDDQPLGRSLGADQFPPSPAAPDWARYDRSDALWVSDRFDALPRYAGFSASGGGAVPGPIARDGTARLDWDGAHVVRVEGAFKAAELACCVDPSLPELLRELARLWAEQRTLSVHDTPSQSDLIAFQLVRAGESRPADLARDGWSAHGRVGAPLAAAVGETTWLAADGPCVLAAPGLVRCSIVALEEPSGDPAAFAVSWGALFDSVLRDPAGIVPLGERTPRGQPAWRAPQGSTAGGRGDERPLGAWCALLAALLALGAWVLRGIRA